MKKVKRWRYYCDHCKKSGGSAWHMKKHEKTCTANPDRHCGFCEIEGNINDIEKLKSIVEKSVSEFWEETKNFSDTDFHDTDFHIKITENLEKDLLKESKGCPACALAAVRQTKGSEFIQFDYKKAKDQFWLDHPDHYGY